MKKNVRMIAILAGLAVVAALGLAAQQQSADKAVDPVCGMTVVKANAKATYDYKGTTYYFCSTGCRESFAKDPEKYLKAQQGAAAPAGQMGQMGMMGQGMMMGQMGQGQMGQGQMGMMQHQPMANCPMMGPGMMMGGRMGRMGRMPRGPMMGAPGFGPLFRLYGDKIEVVVENTKDGAALKVTSKDPEVVKAIQVHMAEHIAMMKKMKEAEKK